jgi:hypothetical protein
MQTLVPESVVRMQGYNKSLIPRQFRVPHCTFRHLSETFTNDLHNTDTKVLSCAVCQIFNLKGLNMIFLTTHSLAAALHEVGCDVIHFLVIQLTSSFNFDGNKMHLCLGVYIHIPVVEIFYRKQRLLRVIGVVVFSNVKLVWFVDHKEVVGV